MLAILAFVAFVIAGLLRLIGSHESMVIGLIIVGGLLVSAEVAWGWNRGGRYRTPPV